MKTHPTLNLETAQDWRPTGGPGEAIRIATFSAPGGQPITVTLKAEGSTELTKSGLRRVLLKVSTTVPTDECGLGSATAQGGFATKRGTNLPVAAHCVVTAPAQAFRFSKDNPNASAFARIVETAVRNLVALMGGAFFIEDIGHDWLNELSMSPVPTGLLGAEPLDPVAGDYGYVIPYPEG